MAEAAIAAQGLGKRLGPLPAPDGVDLQLPAGGVLGYWAPTGRGSPLLSSGYQVQRSQGSPDPSLSGLRRPVRP
jgi:hypothetical protein